MFITRTLKVQYCRYYTCFSFYVFVQPLHSALSGAFVFLYVSLVLVVSSAGTSLFLWRFLCSLCYMLDYCTWIYSHYLQYGEEGDVRVM